MNIALLKKRIFIEAGILFGIIAAVGAVTYLLSSISDDYTENNNTANAKVSKIDVELNALQSKYTFITKNAALYKEVEKKQADGQLSIKRQVAFDKFNQLRSDFGLDDLRLTVSPLQDVKDPKMKTKTSTVSVSDVSVEFNVMSDGNVYQLLNAMNDELPGICVVSHVSMSMLKPLSAEVLQTIGTKGTYPLIKTQIKFNWYSINPVEASEQNEPTQPPRR